MSDAEKDADREFGQDLTAQSKQERRAWRDELRNGILEVVQQLLDEAWDQRVEEAMRPHRNHQEWLEDLQQRVENLEAALAE